MDMQLPLRAHGPSLTSDQARMLDDEFFHSNPLGHFSSKIANLLEAERTSSHPTAESYSEFFDALGLTESEFLIHFDEQERRVQTAVEALALRHQAAEAYPLHLCSGGFNAERQGCSMRVACDRR